MDKQLVDQARKYLGVPFKHRGRTKAGLDCAGLIVRCYKDLERPVVDREVYGREPHRDGLRETLNANTLEVVTSKPWQPGDIVLMKFVSEPHHLGIFGDYFLGGLSLIHSFGEVGKVVEHRLDDVWTARILEVFRHKA